MFRSNTFADKPTKREMGRPSKFDSSTKVRVVLEALKESCTLQELGKKYGVAPNQILAWKEQFLSRANMVFEPESKNEAKSKASKSKEDQLLKKIGQLTIERDFFAEACESLGLKKPLGR